MATGAEQAKKEQGQLAKALLDRAATHIRIGNGFRPSGGWVGGVVPIDPARVLHGSVCTCCPRPGGPTAGFRYGPHLVDQETP